MRFGLIGPPQSGKSTVFRILVGERIFSCGSIPGECGRYVVPDPDLARLARWGGASKVTPADLEIWDPPAHLQIRGSSAGQFLGALRGFDGFINVLPVFMGGAAADDPVEAALSIERTLMGADLQVLEGRRDRIETLYKKSKDAELLKESRLVSRMIAFLQHDRPLRIEIWDDEALEHARQWGLLSIRPILHLLNVGETRLGEAWVDRVLSAGRQRMPWAGWCIASATLELELIGMSEEERTEWMGMYGLSELLPERLVEPLLKSMGVVRFYTVGPKEARVWLLRRGATAVDAAETIHTDIARGFIRAEVIPLDQLLTLKDWQEGRKRGVIRQEGRDYIVMDRDVMLVRFST